tara:strand:+ start:143 stop:529 length:387 start_codon:yes stop_codon:yes gene_type:complete
MTELVIIGDQAKVIKNANSRPLTLYKEDDNSGDKGIFLLGSQYTVPAGKEFLITTLTAFSGNAASYLHCNLKDSAGVVHIYWVLNKGDEPGSSIAIPLQDKWEAGTSPIINSNHNGLTLIIKGVEYDV